MASDLEAELELLRSTLEEKGQELRDIIREETQRKEAELQVGRCVACGEVSRFDVALQSSGDCSGAALTGKVCSAVV